jgi:phosphoglycolate phosphatase-like HAD superfamily hydrolase
MNIFFDVDYTILGLDNSLRYMTKEVFQKIINDGHNIYIWSGMGKRWEVIEEHQLEKYVTDVYEKPKDNFEQKFKDLDIPIIPDFVIDDYPEVVAYFGGLWVQPFFFERNKDNAMNDVYEVICDIVETRTSTNKHYKPKGTILPLF